MFFPFVLLLCTLWELSARFFFFSIDILLLLIKKYIYMLRFKGKKVVHVNVDSYPLSLSCFIFSPWSLPY